MSTTVEKPAFKDTTASVLLDLLRGLAALLVLWDNIGIHFHLSATGRATQNSISTKASRSLAHSSYTLYVMHVPFLVLLTALVSGGNRWVPDAQHILKGLGILAVTLLYAHLVASLTEFHTESIRRWIEGRLGLTKKPTRDQQIFPV